MTVDNETEMVAQVREAHVRAFLQGQTIITPLELRAVIRAALKVREDVAEAAVIWKWKKIGENKDWQADEHDTRLADAVLDYEIGMPAKLSGDTV